MADGIEVLPAAIPAVDAAKTDGLMKGATSLLMKAQVIADNIDTADDYANAIEFRKTLKAGIAEREAAFADPKQKAFAAHRAICDLESKVIQPLKDADRIIQASTTAWKVEQDRLAKERQAELDRIAREQEEARRAAIAEELRKSGPVGEAQAEALVAQPISIRSTQVVAEAAPKVAGVSYVKSYHATVDDLDLLWAAVIAGKVPRKVFTVDQSFLDNQADALKFELNYPGVTVHEKQTEKITRGRGRG
jgi:hypothetical protein